MIPEAALPATFEQTNVNPTETRNYFPNKAEAYLFRLTAAMLTRSGRGIYSVNRSRIDGIHLATIVDWFSTGSDGGIDTFEETLNEARSIDSDLDNLGFGRFRRRKELKKRLAEYLELPTSIHKDKSSRIVIPPGSAWTYTEEPIDHSL